MIFLDDNFDLSGICRVLIFAVTTVKQLFFHLFCSHFFQSNIGAYNDTFFVILFYPTMWGLEWKKTDYMSDEEP